MHQRKPRFDASEHSGAAGAQEVARTSEVDSAEDEVVGVDGGGVKVLVQDHVVVIEAHHLQQLDLRLVQYSTQESPRRCCLYEYEYEHNAAGDSARCIPGRAPGSAGSRGPKRCASAPARLTPLRTGHAFIRL